MRNVILTNWKSSVFSHALQLIDRTDKFKIFLVIILQISFGFLDLLGVMLIGVIGALAITGVSSGQPGNRVTAFLEFVGLIDKSIQFQVAIIGISAATLLIGKTLFSIYFSRKILFFLSRKGAAVSARMVRRLLKQSLLKVQSRSLQTSLYAVTDGINIMTVGVLGILVTLISDLSLLLVLIVGLFAVDSQMALGTFLSFSSIAFVLWKLMHKRARELGLRTAKNTVKNSEAIFEILTTYREASVRDRRGFYAKQIGDQRFAIANLQAEMSFLPSISKYVIEISVVVTAVLFSAFQFWVNEASRAVATLAVFLAATTRIAPAVLRLQQNAITMKSSIASAQPTLDLLQDLEWGEDSVEKWSEPDFTYKGFKPKIELAKVSFRYPEQVSEVISHINLEIPEGSFVGLVGPSGAGKSTLVDLLLGILDPESGEILISGVEPKEVIVRFPGAIAYIPQEVVIVNGSIRKNVLLGFDYESIPDQYVWEALRIAKLDEFVKSLPEGLEASVGDRGTKLSGGQRQRLGIARAMVTKPKLLVLDEATSALDGELELNIGEAIQGMRGDVTIIMIAHRLSTIRECDVVVYLSEGRIVNSGTFEQLKKLVPEFERQAELMGL